MADTRTGSGQTNAGSTLPAGGTLTVQATGQGGVPATGVSAVEVNVTEAANTAGGFLTVSPTTPAPLASDVNFVPGVIVANGGIAALASNGSLNVFNHDGNTDLVLDVAGYFTAAITPVGVAVTAIPASVVANGPATSSVVTTVTNSSGPVFADAVNLTKVPSVTSGTTSCGSLAPTTGSTMANGTFTSGYTASIVAGTCTITATEANGGLAGTTTITQTGANTIAVAPANHTMAANGTDTQSFVATVNSFASAAVAGDTVTFSASGAGAWGTFSPTSGTTGAPGTVSSAYTSSTTAGFCTVTATETQFGNSGTSLVDQTSSPAIAPPTVTFTSGPADHAHVTLPRPAHRNSPPVNPLVT